jgi:hypothetical protein
MNTRVYVITQKECNMPKNSAYIPIQSGNELP